MAEPPANSNFPKNGMNITDQQIQMARDTSRHGIPQSPERLAYKLSEVSQLLGISDSSTRRLIARGQLKPVKSLRHVLVGRPELERFISNN